MFFQEIEVRRHEAPPRVGVRVIVGEQDGVEHGSA